MKSLDELKKLRDASLKKMTMRYTKDGYRIQVGNGDMWYCIRCATYFKRFFRTG